MIDTHVHLNREEFQGQQPAVMARAKVAGVQAFMNVGYDLETSAESVALAAAHDNIWATVGVHPHDASLLADEQGRAHPETEQVLDQLREMAAQPRVLAIGEIGLDFFRDRSPRPAQYKALELQLKIAEELNRPVVFHIRDAWRETLELIDQVGVPSRRGILHAFSGDEAAVSWATSRGFLLGIGGPVTYKNSRLPALVRQAGIEHLVLETDAPWLPPVPHRGQRNEPAYLALTRDRVADVLGLSPEEVDRQTTHNFEDLFLGGPLVS